MYTQLIRLQLHWMYNVVGAAFCQMAAKDNIKQVCMGEQMEKEWVVMRLQLQATYNDQISSFAITSSTDCICSIWWRQKKKMELRGTICWKRVLGPEVVPEREEHGIYERNNWRPWWRQWCHHPFSKRQNAQDPVGWVIPWQRPAETESTLAWIYLFPPHPHARAPCWRRTRRKGIWVQTWSNCHLCQFPSSTIGRD